MSRIITDSKVSGQYYIPSLSLSLDTKNAKKNVGTRKKTKQSVKVAPGVVSRRHHRRSSSPSSSFPACSAGTASSETQRLLLERLCPSRKSRRFKRGIIGKKYSAPFLCVLCACIFSSKKRRQNTSPSEQNKPYYLQILPLTKQSAVVHTTKKHVSFETTRPPSLANIHPSIHRTTTHYYYYRIETPTTIAGVKRSRERERERERERGGEKEKILRGKKKGGNFVLRTIKMHSRHRVVQTRDDFDNATTTREQQGFRGATKTDPSSFRSFAEQMTTTTTTRGLTTKQKLLGPTLLLVGTISLTVFFLVQFGAIELHEKDETRGTKAATFVIGVLSFLPGAYATTVLVQVRRGAEGWSYEMLRDT